jgi:dihydrodipicolinate synthase/N-acetylneuraminate lyase
MSRPLISGVLPALITPLDKQGNVLTHLAEPIIKMYLREKADGLYALGWTGEGAHLEPAKRKQWAQAILEYGRNKIPIFIHVGYNKNLDDSVELARHAEEYGAFAVASVGIGEEASLEDNIDYFKRISSAAPNTPFFIYWVSQGKTLTGGKEMAAADILNALDKVPTFRGIKFTDTNFFMLDRFKKYRPDITILTGADEMAVLTQYFGADGNIGALQGITCYHYKVMWQKFLEGNYREARELQYRANEVVECYAQPGIGSLPGIKAVFDQVYGIPAGNASPDGPFGSRMPSAKDTETLVRVFRKNIITATY